MNLQKKKNKGTTLLELLVTIVIFGIIAGILFMLLINSKMVFQSSSTRSLAKLDLETATWEISREVRRSDVKFITDGSKSGILAFSFISAVNNNGQFVLDTNGTPLWQKQVIYYVDSASKKLFRKEIYIDFKANPSALASLSISNLQAQMDGKGKFIANSITNLALTPPLTGESAPKLTIEAQNINSKGNLDKQSRVITIFMYN